MSEIKTCEQYVLNKVQELEEQNITLQENLQFLKAQYDEQEKKMAMLETLFRKYTKVKCFESSTGGLKYYISIDDIDGWLKASNADFEYLVETFGLMTEEEKKDAGISD